MFSGKRSDRFIIGLTGNIGTGKSLVRRMLEALGAYGIDGDLLAFQAAQKDAPGYRQIIAAFGEEILSPDGLINRQKLGQIVFDNPARLVKLESIIHPIVLAEMERLLLEHPARVNVIEAIKLLETDVRNQCDSIWVTTASADTQHLRLVKERGMSTEVAMQRIEVQADPVLKIKAAQVVITNEGSIVDLWQQVARAWNTVLSNLIAQDFVAPAPELMPAGLASSLLSKKAVP